MMHLICVFSAVENLENLWLFVGKVQGRCLRLCFFLTKKSPLKFTKKDVVWPILDLVAHVTQSKTRPALMCLTNRFNQIEIHKKEG